MVTQEDVRRAQKRLEKAERRMEEATNILGAEVKQHPGESLTKSQRCIEHCAKSVFRLMGVNSPDTHEIPLEGSEAAQLMNAVRAELNETYMQKTARLLFLADLYGGVYPVSEYGVDIDSLTVEPAEFLDRMEADQAYNHADAAVTLAKEIINATAESLPPER